MKNKRPPRITDAELYGPRHALPDWTAHIFADDPPADIMLTQTRDDDGDVGDFALLTVRGKDTDLNEAQLRALARAALRAAGAIAKARRARGAR